MISVRDRERAHKFGHAAILTEQREPGETGVVWVPGPGSENPILIHAEASAARRAGRFSEAEALYLEAIRISERLFDTHHPHLATVAYGLVELYAKQGRIDEARRLSEDVACRIDGSRAVLANCRTLSRLSDLLRWADRVEDGAELYRQALAHRREAYGDCHPKVVECVAGFAEFHKRAGDVRRARALLREAVAMLNDVDETASQAATHAVREARDFIAYAA